MVHSHRSAQILSQQTRELRVAAQEERSRRRSTGPTVRHPSIVIRTLRLALDRSGDSGSPSGQAAIPPHALSPHRPGNLPAIQSIRRGFVLRALRRANDRSPNLNARESQSIDWSDNWVRFAHSARRSSPVPPSLLNACELQPIDWSDHWVRSRIAQPDMPSDLLSFWQVASFCTSGRRSIPVPPSPSFREFVPRTHSPITSNQRLIDLRLHRRLPSDSIHHLMHQGRHTRFDYGHLSLIAGVVRRTWQAFSSRRDVGGVSATSR
jgi:hypothetical protein